eukprot:6213335-Pleurochrysis_carterae.AAC.3
MGCGRPAVGVAIAAHKLIPRSADEGGVLLDARAEGTHWKCDHRAGIALLKLDDGRHQPKRTVGCVQVERRREMTTVGRVLDDVLATGVARSAQKVRGPAY